MMCVVISVAVMTVPEVPMLVVPVVAVVMVGAKWVILEKLSMPLLIL